MAEATTGIIPEATLVIYTRGSNADFTKACSIVEFELLGEFDEYDLPEDDEFYEEKKDKDGNVTGRRLTTAGRLFFTFSDLSAKDKLLSLWRKWINNEPLRRGNGEWAKIFPYIYEIKVWSARERLEEFRMLNYWNERLDDPDDHSPVKFEIELWCHGDAARREHALAEATATIRANGGNIFGQSVTIPEIRFQALKAELPKETLRAWIKIYERNNDESVGFFGYQGIRFFRPIGQCTIAMEAGAPDDPIATGEVSGLPLVAIFDGHPLAGHRLLSDKVIIDDPEDFDARYESPSEYRHGTAIASPVLHGDLNERTPLRRPVYIRPVQYPDPNARLFNSVEEKIPEDVFAEDLTLRAVRRMFEEENGEPSAAPTVKIINISLGDKDKPFIHSISSWGRLLDWLAWKYKVLFVVSAGNSCNPPAPQSIEMFNSLSPEEKVAATVKVLGGSTASRSILSPADSVNALTIGAQHTDASGVNNHPGLIDLLPARNLMSPYSTHGPGYRRCLKPDVLLPGGRQLYRIEPVHNELAAAQQTLRGPGIKAASPGEPGQLNNTGYSYGTSNAAALASNGAGRIYEMLLELDQSDAYIHDQISDSTIAALIKTLVVHSTFKGESLELMERILDDALPNRKGNGAFLS